MLMSGALAIGGLEKCSFVDFPGRLAAVVFTRGCNLRCRYCHNPALVAFEGSGSDLDESAVLEFLETRVGLLSGVSVTGGEPLCQNALGPFLRRVRGLGFKVKLDTNGTMPERLDDLLGSPDRPDYVAMDFKDVPDGYGALCGVGAGSRVAESLQVLRRQGVPFELRTTVCGGYHDAARLEAMAAVIGKGEKWFLQRFHPGTTLDPSADFTAPDVDALKSFAQRMAREREIDCQVR